MGKLSSLLWGAAIGAGMMYFMDPQNGDRRQAMIRQKVTHWQNEADNAVATATNDLRNRAQGMMAEGMARVSNQGASDQVLKARVRSRLGFLTRHPGAIQVDVQNHTAILSGDILSEEVDHLIHGVSMVQGIDNVQNHMRSHQTAENIPQLQGEGWMPGDNGGQWAPSTRLLATIGAGYLMLYGMARGGIIGFFSRIAGFGLGARALTNMNMDQMLGMGMEGNPIQVRKTINIDVPVQQVYKLWSNFENFPKFMANVESIKNTGGNKSHWIVKGPAGSKVEFDAIETKNQPNELIAWETTPDSQVKNQGQVRFKDSGQKGTQVSVSMSYMPPAGVAGAAVANLFGKDPKSEMDADLMRMKSLLEEGKTTADSQKISRQDVMPVTGGQGGNQPGKSGQHSEHSGEHDMGGHTGHTPTGTVEDPLAPTDQ